MFVLLSKLNVSCFYLLEYFTFTVWFSTPSQYRRNEVALTEKAEKARRPAVIVIKNDRLFICEVVSISNTEKILERQIKRNKDKIACQIIFVSFLD